jgi:hypothetical protein
MVHRLKNGKIQITALNFGNDEIVEHIDLNLAGIELQKVANRHAFEIVEEENLGFVQDDGILKVTLCPLEGKTIVIG